MSVGPRRRCPVARGVSPPPRPPRQATPPRGRLIAALIICLLASTLVGWFVFAGPGASFLRSLNQPVPGYESSVAVADGTQPDSPQRPEPSTPLPNPDFPAPAANHPPLPVAEFPQAAPVSPPGKAVTFDDVHAILQATCVSCHGGQKRKGGLDVRSIAALEKGGDSGPAYVAGQPGASVLWEAIETGRMPPDKSKRLTRAEQDLVRRWIERGAK